MERLQAPCHGLVPCTPCSAERPSHGALLSVHCPLPLFRPKAALHAVSRGN